MTGECITYNHSRNLSMTAAEALATHDGLGLALLVRRGEVTAQELLAAAIARIEAVNPALNAVVAKLYDQAAAALAAGLPDGPFAGVPFLLKDLGGAQAGVPMTGGSRFFKDYLPPVDSELVRRYKQAGLVILGRTNTPECGLAATTEPVLFGACRNPWDLTRTPGGSSGGAAAAVAAGCVPLAHASDGGGSIRIPASCCGLFGLKVSRGRMTLAPYLGESIAGCSVEHVVSRSVRDSAAALDATAGPAPGDPYQAPPPARPFLAEVGAAPGRLRIALLTRPFNGGPIAAACAQAAEAAARLCAELGHDVEEASPSFDAAALDEAFRQLFAVGASANILQRAQALGRVPDADGFERVTLATLAQAAALSATDYVLVLNRLHGISRQIAAFFETYDVLLTPTLAEPPVPLGTIDMMSTDIEAFAAQLWRFTPFTYPFNVTGQPAMSVPLAWNAGLPIGVQFVGRYGDEAGLFRLAAQLEQAAPWAGRRPPEPVV
jgi:Asp-tRNA(Asn)/Glu-tRNA(Gln) amidotransferase A subunit family amidase